MFSSPSSVKLVKYIGKQNYHQPPTELVRLKVWQHQIVPFFCFVLYITFFCQHYMPTQLQSLTLLFLGSNGQMYCFFQPRVLWFYFYAYLSKIFFSQHTAIQKKSLHHIICIWVNGRALKLSNLPSFEKRDDLWGKPQGMKWRNTPNTKHTPHLVGVQTTGPDSQHCTGYRKNEDVFSLWRNEPLGSRARGFPILSLNCQSTAEMVRSAVPLPGQKNRTAQSNRHCPEGTIYSMNIFCCVFYCLFLSLSPLPNSILRWEMPI